MRWLLLALTLCGCRRDLTDIPNCAEADREKLAQFVVQCVDGASKASNHNYSDAEDIIQQCERTVKATYCPKEPGYWQHYTPYPCRLNRQECKE
jgi:hypothetical protein